MASTQSDKSETDEETTSEEAEQAEEGQADETESDETESGETESDESESESDESESDESESDESDAGADDDAGDEAADEDGAERAAGGAASPSTTGKAKKGDRARPNKKDGLTAGARLAAAKAAKAARKAAKRGKEKKEADPVAQVRDSQLAKKAQEAGSWAAQNRNTVIAALVVALLGIGGWLGWSSYTDQQAEAAGALLADAVEIAQAEIVAEEEPGDDAAGDDAPAADDAEPDADAPPTFPTEEARAEAALEAYRLVLTQYPSSDAAIWARLGEARALSDLGRHGEAREAYEAAEAEGGGDPSVALRALEGSAFTFEAEDQWDQALQVYERLAAIDGQRYQPVAEYHRARMYIAKGERERATETLRELVEDLGQAEEDDERQDFAYVLAQAETRLRELDPSAAPPPRANESPLGGLGGGPGGQMSNEQLQELIRQFQQKQLQEQQGGGAE